MDETLPRTKGVYMYMQSEVNIHRQMWCNFLIYASLPSLEDVLGSATNYPPAKLGYKQTKADGGHGESIAGAHKPDMRNLRIKNPAHPINTRRIGPNAG